MQAQSNFVNKLRLSRSHAQRTCFAKMFRFFSLLLERKSTYTTDEHRAHIKKIMDFHLSKNFDLFAE